LEESFASAATDLSCQGANVELSCFLLLSRNGDPGSAFASQLDYLIPENTFMRSVAQRSKGNGGIRDLSCRFNAGDCDGALLSGGPQFQVVSLCPLQSTPQVKTKLSVSGSCERQRQSSRQSPWNGHLGT
jgi:hypothetical protein